MRIKIQTERISYERITVVNIINSYANHFPNYSNMFGAQKSQFAKKQNDICLILLKINRNTMYHVGSPGLGHIFKKAYTFSVDQLFD